jgi:hypothetical protein
VLGDHMQGSGVSNMSEGSSMSGMGGASHHVQMMMKGQSYTVRVTEGSDHAPFHVGPRIEVTRRA